MLISVFGKFFYKYAIKIFQTMPNYSFSQDTARESEALTLTGSLHGSSSQTVCPGRTLAPG